MAEYQWNYDLSDKGYIEFHAGLKSYGYVSESVSSKPIKKDPNKFWDPRRKLWVHAPADKWSIAPINNSQLFTKSINVTFFVYKEISDQWERYRNSEPNQYIYWQPSELRWVVIKVKYPVPPSGKSTATGDGGITSSGDSPSEGNKFVSDERHKFVKKEIENLKKLRDDGIINDTQYNQQVLKILDDNF